MRITSFISALALAPVLAFAQDPTPTMDATFQNVSPGCYFAFKAGFAMLTQIAEALNEKVGQTVLIIDNVTTPVGNPSTYGFTVEYSPTGNAVGDYSVYQQYSSSASTLYLNVTEMPATMTGANLDNVWGGMQMLFDACTL